MLAEKCSRALAPVLPQPQRNQSGQAILESILVMFVICILFFGLLQIFHLTVAKMMTNYSAVTAGRSSSVGFAEYLVDRNGRCGSIAASGQMTFPTALNSSNPIAQYADERVLIPQYIIGRSWLEYKYWYNGDHGYDSDNDDSDYTEKASFHVSQNRSNTGATTVTAGYNNYPLVMPMRFLLTNSRATDISSEATFVDFSRNFLND